MKTVLITGVSSGIGLGITKKLLDNGYQVIGSVRSLEKANELEYLFGDNFKPLIFDICKQEEVQLASKKLEELLNGNNLDVLINNAGMAEIGPLLHVSMDDFRKQLDVLVVGQLNVIQHFYTYLISSDKSKDNGRIINISSISGAGSNPFFGCYASGKHALEGLSKTLRIELRVHGIKVIVVAPGNILTSLWEKQPPELADKYKETIYFQSVRKKLENINTNKISSAMSVNDFVDVFHNVLEEKEPANRYTIIKAKKKYIPFSKEKVRLIPK